MIFAGQNFYVCSGRVLTLAAVGLCPSGGTLTHPGLRIARPVVRTRTRLLTVRSELAVQTGVITVHACINKTRAEIL